MFTDPLKNLKAFELKEDNIVADLGAGTGHYAIAAGTLVPHGKVYAIELEKDFLVTIKNKVKDAGLANIECLLGDVEKLGGTSIADGVVDGVIASNILFQVDHKDKFIEEIKRILKNKGKVLLVDWTPSAIMKEVAIFPKDKARALFEQNGFVFDREINAGDFHYGMILIKS